LRNGKYGIIVENSSFIDIKNNILNPTYDDGVYIKTSHDSNIIGNEINVIIEDESGITLFNSNNIKIDNNNIKCPTCHDNRFLIINLTASEDNTINFLGNNFIFKDAGYQCHYGDSCDCCCKDQKLCSNERLTGDCINHRTGTNLIGSKNTWIFSGGG
jgi:parallel beta-helix repeat protein